MVSDYSSRPSLTQSRRLAVCRRAENAFSAWCRLSTSLDSVSSFVLGFEFLGATSYLLEKEDFDRLELREIGLALNAKEVVDVFFRSHLLEDLIDVDFL